VIGQILSIRRIPNKKDKKNMRRKVTGLGELNDFLKDQDANGRKLFDLLVNEIGTDEELRSLITRRSLLSLILHTIDHQKRIRALANSTKSNEVSVTAKQKSQAILYTWLDKNIQKYKGKLDLCAADAEKQIKQLGRGYYWIRVEITAYNRRNKKS
jgi:hypothetical protein